MSNLEVVKSYTVPKTEIVIDLDSSDYYYPTLSCVSAGKNEANDAVQIESVKVNEEKMFKFRFKSEVKGAYGLFGNLYDDFSNKVIYLTESGKVFATGLDKSGAPDLSIKYELKDMDRVSLILAQALGCYAYSLAEDGYMSSFIDFLALAKTLDNERNLSAIEGSLPLSYDPPCALDNAGCNFYNTELKY